MKLTAKKIFLIDAIGASISAVLLRYVLPFFQEYIGMPTDILISLSMLATILMSFSFLNYFDNKKELKLFLIVIAVGNFIYCLISLYYMIVYFTELTILGLSYFAVEKVIVLTLAFIEIKTALK
ncbi:MAG: hypothetical protein ACPGVD_10295 [Flavobacteriales bacterium]